MIDILLINPPIALSQWESKLGSKLSPMGLLSLASYVRERDISVKIIDAYNLGIDIKSVLDQIKEESPAYVGITATTNMIYSAAQMAKEIKEAFPDIITIIGGSHVTALPEDTINQFKHFDVGIYGEGEKTLFELIVSDKIDRNIDGIIFRNNGKVVKIADFGAFVNFIGNRDGLVHISELAPERVGKTTDIVNEGDEIFVKVLAVDDRGKVRLSMRVVDQETGEERVQEEAASE